MENYKGYQNNSNGDSRRMAPPRRTILNSAISRLASKNNELLPRLLYLGDVPVEASYHGSALLFRLLEDYPPHLLTIVEARSPRSLPARRLQGVTYEELPEWPGARLERTRFAPLAKAWMMAGHNRTSRALAQLISRCRAQAILTVAHGWSWLSAANGARKHKLPLHLVVHDHWLEFARVSHLLAGYQNRLFARIYRS